MKYVLGALVALSLLIAAPAPANAQLMLFITTAMGIPPHKQTAAEKKSNEFWDQQERSKY